MGVSLFKKKTRKTKEDTMPIGTLGMAAIGLGADAARTGMGLLLEGHNDRRQLKQQGKLQQQQIEGQKEMARFNQEQQLALWNATGYGGQTKQMKDAGINPALMYGMGGGGGQSSAAAPGNVSGAAAPSGGGEVMGMMKGSALETAATMAQIEVMKSQAKKNNAEADNEAGVNKELKTAQTQSLTQGVENQKAVEVLTKTENRIKEFEADYAGKTLNKRIEALEYIVGKTWKELDLLTTQAWVAEDTAQTKIETAKTELVGLTLRNVLTGAQIENTREDTKLKGSQQDVNYEVINKMAQEVMQGWDKLSQTQKQVRISDMMANHSTDVTREVKNDVIHLLDQIIQYKTHTTPTVRVNEVIKH